MTHLMQRHGVRRFEEMQVKKGATLGHGRSTVRTWTRFAPGERHASQATHSLPWPTAHARPHTRPGMEGQKTSLYLLQHELRLHKMLPTAQVASWLLPPPLSILLSDSVAPGTLHHRATRQGQWHCLIEAQERYSPEPLAAGLVAVLVLCGDWHGTWAEVP